MVEVGGFDGLTSCLSLNCRASDELSLGAEKAPLALINLRRLRHLCDIQLSSTGPTGAVPTGSVSFKYQKHEY